MAERIVPVAYVTKWARTSGILTWSNALEVERGFLYVNGDLFGPFAGPKHWTTDKAVAEERWRQAVEKEAKRLKLAAKKYEALAEGAPVYAKEEG